MKKHKAQRAVLGNRPDTARRAVTLTELLVVLVIISLLATVAVPVYVNKVEQAKISTARMEVREIAHAQEQCALIHGFYVPLQVLDNLIYDVDTHSSGNPRTDDMENEDQDIYLIVATRSVELQYGGDQLRLRDWEGVNRHPMVQNLYTKWAGPFLNPQRVAFGEEIQRNLLTSAEENEATSLDFPLDPWGNPYRFYSPIGIIGSDALTEHLPVGAPGDKPSGSWTNFSNGQLTQNDDRFDRFAIVSFGPNMRTDAQGGGTGFTDTDSDDIVFLFGAQFTESSFRAF